MAENDVIIFLQAGKETKYYASVEASLVQKILIPVLLLICAGVAAPFFLFNYERYEMKMFMFNYERYASRNNFAGQMLLLLHRDRPY